MIFRNSSRRAHRRAIRPMNPTQTGGDTDRRLLLLDAADNILVATSRIHGGETVLVEDARVTIPADVPIGHTLSRRGRKSSSTERLSARLPPTSPLGPMFMSTMCGATTRPPTISRTSGPNTGAEHDAGLSARRRSEGHS